jgi:hypothetical protein
MNWNGGDENLKLCLLFFHYLQYTFKEIDQQKAHTFYFLAPHHLARSSTMSMSSTLISPKQSMSSQCTFRKRPPLNQVHLILHNRPIQRRIHALRVRSERDTGNVHIDFGWRTADGLHVRVGSRVDEVDVGLVLDEHSER